MSSEKITAAQVLFPVTLISLVLVVFLGFQTTLLVTDREGLHQAQAGQDKPLQQIEKVKAQVNALAVGTLQLSKQGNKDAQTIIAALKKNGIDVSDQQPAGSAPQQAPAPAAQ